MCVLVFVRTPLNLELVFVSQCAEQISRLLKDSVPPEGPERSPSAHTGSMKTEPRHKQEVNDGLQILLKQEKEKIKISSTWSKR